MGFKEIIELPPGVIQDRWHLNEGEGAAHLFMGSVTRGMLGGGFIYTNKDSLSLGIVVGMEHLRAGHRSRWKSYKLLDAFKEMPQIKPLVDGGTTVEYSAHAIYEGGIAKMPKLFGDGYLLVGDTAGLSSERPGNGAGHGLRDRLRATTRPGRWSTPGQRGDFSAAGPWRSTSSRSRAASCSRTWRRPGRSPTSSRTRGSSRHYPQAVSQLMEQVFTIGPGPRQQALQHGHRRGPQGLPQRDHHQRAPRPAEDVGRAVMTMSIEAKLGLDVFKIDKERHITIDNEKCRNVCTLKACLWVCPANLYEIDDQGNNTVNFEGCLECGTCLISCDHAGSRVALPPGRIRGPVPDGVGPTAGPIRPRPAPATRTTREVMHR